jgi:hypothetical protein
VNAIPQPETGPSPYLIKTWRAHALIPTQGSTALKTAIKPSGTQSRRADLLNESLFAGLRRGYVRVRAPGTLGYLPSPLAYPLG